MTSGTCSKIKRTEVLLSRFTDRLNAELKTFKEFELLLQEEQQTLIDGQIDLLIALAPRKSMLIKHLSDFSDERTQVLSDAGHESSPAGMLALLDETGANAGTRQIWAALLTLAREADHTNRRNGALIETHLSHNQQALSVLRAAANPVNNLYSASGQLSHMPGSKPIDKA
ncbi:MAG: flagellar protein FlgN [Sulfuricellaceae bacterium]|nr:flagellar protein FlgN [Sulfuricellaceae bacterium]